MSNENEDFDLFATDVEDNLQETLAKGGYRWTNKYTAILAGLVLITASVSGGIWYGNKHAASSGAASLAGFASRIRGAAAGGAFTGAAGAAGGAGAAAGGFGGAGAAGGFGGSRITGTVTKVNGTTLTITLDAAPATPVAPGDAVSVRDTGGTAATGASTATGTQTTPTTSSASGTKSGAATAAPSSKPSVGGAAAGNGAAGNGGGGRFSNPAFTACLAKNGVTIAAGARPDRTDPKVAAAIQACASTLGLPSGAGGGGARPAPTATP